LSLTGDGPGNGPKPFLQLPQFELRGRSELLDIWCVPGAGEVDALKKAQDV